MTFTGHFCHELLGNRAFFIQIFRVKGFRAGSHDARPVACTCLLWTNHYTRFDQSHLMSSVIDCGFEQLRDSARHSFPVGLVREGFIFFCKLLLRTSSILSFVVCEAVFTLSLCFGWRDSFVNIAEWFHFPWLNYISLVLLFWPYWYFFISISSSFKRFGESVAFKMASKLPPNIPVVNGKFEDLPVKVQDFVADKVKLCKPDKLHICDGSKEENEGLIKELMDAGIATPLHKHDNWYV